MYPSSSPEEQTTFQGEHRADANLFKTVEGHPSGPGDLPGLRGTYSIRIFIHKIRTLEKIH